MRRHFYFRFHLVQRNIKAFCWCNECYATCDMHAQPRQLRVQCTLYTVVCALYNAKCVEIHGCNINMSWCCLWCGVVWCDATAYAHGIAATEMERHICVGKIFRLIYNNLAAFWGRLHIEMNKRSEYKQ